MNKINEILGQERSFLDNYLDSGYERLPSGLLIQWGFVCSTVANGDIVAVYPKAFEKVFAVFSQIFASSTASLTTNMTTARLPENSSSSTTQCVFKTYGGGPYCINWLAIGI